MISFIYGEWNARKIVLSMEGQALNTINLAIGGKNGGNPDKISFLSRYEIDYVRVYQKKN